MAKGRRVGRPVTVDPAKLEWAAHLREAGHTINEIVTKTGIARTSLCRHLPPCRPDPSPPAAARRAGRPPGESGPTAAATKE